MKTEKLPPLPEPYWNAVTGSYTREQVEAIRREAVELCARVCREMAEVEPWSEFTDGKQAAATELESLIRALSGGLPRNDERRRDPLGGYGRRDEAGNQVPSSGHRQA